MLNVSELKRLASTTKNADAIIFELTNIMYTDDISVPIDGMCVRNQMLYSNVYTDESDQLFLKEIDNCVSAIRTELESLSQNEEWNCECSSIYYWKHDNIYIKSNNKYKVYLYVLFNEYFIYKLFGECDDFRYMWNFYKSEDDVIDIREIINEYMTYSNIQLSIVNVSIEL
jgi:hypothetical protein